MSDVVRPTARSDGYKNSGRNRRTASSVEIGPRTDARSARVRIARRPTIGRLTSSDGSGSNVSDLEAVDDVHATTRRTLSPAVNVPTEERRCVRMIPSLTSSRRSASLSRWKLYRDHRHADVRNRCEEVFDESPEGVGQSLRAVHTPRVGAGSSWQRCQLITEGGAWC